MKLSIGKSIEKVGKFFFLFSLIMIILLVLIQLVVMALPSLGCDVGIDVGIEIYCGDIIINTPVEHLLNIPGFYSFWVFYFLPLLTLWQIPVWLGITTELVNTDPLLYSFMAVWALLTLCVCYYFVKSIIYWIKEIRTGEPESKSSAKRTIVLIVFVALVAVAIMFR